MPSYTYKCTECDAVIERPYKIGTAPKLVTEFCAECGTATEHQKTISNSGTFVLNCGGFYSK